MSTFSRRTPRPRFGYHHNNKAFLDSPPSPRKIMRNKEGGGAPKGASNHGRAISGARQRAKQPRPAQFRAPFACFAGAALTFRRSTAALRRLLGSSPGRASWNYRVQTGGPSPAPVQRAPRGPVIVPAGTMPRVAGSGMCRSARGNRSRSAFRSTLAKGVPR